MLTESASTSDSYNIFLERFTKIYNEAFPERKIEIKQKNQSSPWISKGFRKPSKRKQCLYATFLKQRTDENYETFKIYKNLFGKLKKTVKKSLFPK